MICPLFPNDGDDVKIQRTNLMTILQGRLELGQVSSYPLLPGAITAFIFRFFKSGIGGCVQACLALLHEQCVLELLPLSAVPSCRAVCIELNDEAVLLLEKQLVDRGCATLSKPLLACWKTARDVTLQLLRYLIQRVDEVVPLLERQQPDPVSRNLAHKYNPSISMEAYYFGDRLRDMPRYPFADNTPVDEPVSVESCVKKRAHNSKEAHFFFVFCPEHGHCHGLFGTCYCVVTFYRFSRV